MPTNATNREERADLLCVFSNQELSRVPVLCSSLATILNLRQKSSPASPRLGSKTSSEFPRMIGSAVANLTPSRGAGDFGGRVKAGTMGDTGGWSRCGVLGTADGEREEFA